MLDPFTPHVMDTNIGGNSPMNARGNGDWLLMGSKFLLNFPPNYRIKRSLRNNEPLVSTSGHLVGIATTSDEVLCIQTSSDEPQRFKIGTRELGGASLNSWKVTAHVSCMSFYTHPAIPKIPRRNRIAANTAVRDIPRSQAPNTGSRCRSSLQLINGSINKGVSTTQWEYSPDG